MRRRPEDKRAAPLRATDLFLAVTVVGLVAGGGAHAAGAATLGRLLWLLVTAMGTATAAWWILEAARRRRLGVDVVALLALVGTVVVKEYLAGALITVMLATGRLLEARAAARARRDLSSLVERTPRVARVHVGEDLEERPLEQVRVGDLVSIFPGEVVPVDGLVEQGAAVLDESALTGETLPRRLLAGEAVRSGAVNGGQVFDLRVTTPATEGTYAAIVRLVETAETTPSPTQRLADRYAYWFVVASLVVGGGAWLLSGSFSRAVAVLVVATPCPLVLAVPVALVSGLSLAARKGVIVKGGAVLETLARGGTLLLDKTGTLTRGAPVVVDVLARNGADVDSMLRLSASLDQLSSHVLAGPIVASARARGLDLVLPGEVEEESGSGIRGVVEGREVAVGRAEWLGAEPGDPWIRQIRKRASLDNLLSVFVAVGGGIAGAVLLEDPIRNDAARTIRNLRRDGFDRIVMLSGDRSEIAESVGAVLGLDAVFAERSPAEKAEAVELEHRRAPTVMVGDGINDAPALALAGVGVALASRGSSASSEAADVVLMVDRLENLGDAVLIARRSKLMATEAAVIGIGLSIAAMAVAAAGYLAASWGALLQEGIDVIAIVVALRALLPASTPRIAPEEDALISRFTKENLALDAVLQRIRATADRLVDHDLPAALADASALSDDLASILEPLQSAEEGELYPLVARLVGGLDPTGSLLRAHAEIRHDVVRIVRVLHGIDPADPDHGDILDLQRLLYDLHAVLRLHLAQEREGYLSLFSSSPALVEPTPH